MTAESLNNITISKVDLLQILRENLEAHNEVFNAATQAYYENLRAELEESKGKAEALAKLLSEKLENVTTTDPNAGMEDFRHGFYIRAVKPTSYESFYKTAIRKAELSQREEFVLADSDFQRYVMNNWEWKNEFINNATTYLGNSSFAVSGMLASGIQKFNK